MADLDRDGDAPQQKRARKEAKRYAKLRDGFTNAAHSLLTACSQEEFISAFPFERKERIYEFYAEVVSALHTGILTEFQALCEEMKIQQVLQKLEKPNPRPASCVQAPPPSLVVAKDAIDAKQAEADELRRILLEEEQQKNELVARIESMRKEAEAMEKSQAPSAILKMKQALEAATFKSKEDAQIGD